jgi:Carboxypeptidase regulatory-like domain
MERKQYLWLMAAVLGLIISARTFAQSTTATMLGTVTDKTGATVAGAKVTARNTETNLTRTVASNEQGEYRIEFLPVGNYELEVSGPGFKKAVTRGVVLQVGADSRADVQLEVGDVNEAVSVSAEVPLVNTSSPELGRTIENAEITNLPLVNRNVYSLLDITPGVERNDNSIVLGYPEQRTLINGGTDGGAGSVNYYLDGGPNMAGLRNTGNATPNPDGLKSFACKQTATTRSTADSPRASSM